MFNKPQVQLRYNYHDKNRSPDTKIIFELDEGNLYPFDDPVETKKILKDKIESFQINYTFYMTSVDQQIHDERASQNETR